jgi:hypothetical protein
MYLIIDHDSSGSVDFDIECYCSFNIQDRQRQTMDFNVVKNFGRY